MLQLLEEHELQALWLADGEVPPDVRQNRETALGAVRPHLGQGQVSIARLMGLISSNLCLQPEQEYSYMGMVLHSDYLLDLRYFLLQGTFNAHLQCHG